MKVYHRQALEDRIVNMAHKRDAAAKLLLTEVFYGTPGSLVGVIVCNPDKLSIVFLARATHPDEPIPHFKNLEYSMSTVLNGAAANLKHHTLDAYVTPDELRIEPTALTVDLRPPIFILTPEVDPSVKNSVLKEISPLR